MELRPIQGADELKQLEVLLNSTFPVPAGGSFFDDFPVWDSRHSMECVRLGAFESSGVKGTLVSSALGRPALLNSSQGPVEIWIIGGVATLSSHRGRGLASQLVAAQIEKAHLRKARFGVLWGSELSMYSKLGFELCGTQLRIPLSGSFGGRMDPGIEIHRGWNPALLKLIGSRSEGLVMTDRDLSWISAHRNVDWWWTGKKDTPTAFLGYGRGIDLPGIVHEWGGEREALLHLLSAFLSRNPEAQIIGSENSFRQYGFPVPSATREHLCLCRPLGDDPIPDFWFWGLDSA